MIIQVREALNYDPTTGFFTWVNPRSRRVRVGDVAGSLTNYGYIVIRLNNRAYLAHRLAWLYVHGNWPAGEIDHRNGVRTDNRLENLRDVPGAINRQNVRRAKSTSKSGLLGVKWLPRLGKWQARITVDGRGMHLGVFLTKLEAQQAYISAKRDLHEGCTV
jgi:hypothetical protein